VYVAIKGGEQAIRAAHALLDAYRRGDPDTPELSLSQIREQLGLAVDRVMAEASLYDPNFAALAVKQAQGDLVEAIFLLRAYRTTLPRLGESKPVDSARMAVLRRISAVYKDLPGGQILGPTFDYTHRLLDFELAERRHAEEPAEADEPLDDELPRVLDWLNEEGLIEAPNGPDDPAGSSDPEPGDITLTMTRCAVQLVGAGIAGFGYVAGYAHEHALLAALFDALLQDASRQQEIMDTLISPESERLARHKARKSKQAAATRASFFTLERGHIGL